MDNPQPSGSLGVKAEAGIDWLTVVYNKDQKGWGKATEVVLTIMKEQEREGNRIHPARMYGYIGYGCRGSFVGERDNLCMLQATSIRGQFLFDAINPAEPRCARIDTQVTIWGDYEDDKRGTREYDRCNRANEALSSARRRKLSIVTNNENGFTLYIGSAFSNERGRLYNKGSESNDQSFEGAWRYEVVFRGRAARQCAPYLATRSQPVATAVAGVTAGWFRDRGCRECVYGDSLHLPLDRPSVTDNEKTLAWLATQVRPAIRRLLKTHDRDTILRVLGLL